ncbi:family 65 glycoside hydrolase [Bisporella sp. PMI_857]|nr:family 65 glycoside hydrolase [Bisporella sp. PMI_857]
MTCRETKTYILVSDDETWLLCTDSFVPNRYQTAPHVANGYFGQSLPAEGAGYWIQRAENGTYAKNTWPLDQPRAVFGTISGFWNLQPNVTYAGSPENLQRGGESVIAGIPNWTGLTITSISGEQYLPGIPRSSVEHYSQCLSSRDGIVHTNVTWRPARNSSCIFQLNYTVLAHRTRINLGLVRLDITASGETEFQITDILDGAGAVRSEFVSKAFEPLGALIWTSVKPQGISNVTAWVVSVVEFESTDQVMLHQARQTRIDATSTPGVSTNASTVAQRWRFRLKLGNSLTVYKHVGIASSDHFQERTHEVALSSALRAKGIPWEALLQEHIQTWKQAWESADIIVPKARELQRAARASLFYILASLPEEKHHFANSIHVGGLSSDSYAGLVFWDAETWMYPSILALHPSYVPAINDYRSRLLGQAIRNAQSYGYSGSLFPWTSGRYGNCTGTGLCKDYQYHLNTDICQSHWHFFLQTRNMTWLAEAGWPIIKNVADMFAAYVMLNTTTGRYETILLSEPDEFAYNKNNGAFTNVGIKKLLGEWAPSAARLLNITIPPNWTDIADSMEVPYNSNDNITLAFTGMDGEWKVKQASTILLQYPLGYWTSLQQIRNDITYYSAANIPGGPAMTWSIFSIVEAQHQSEGCAAYTYLLRSYEPYIREPFYQFSEIAMDRDQDNPAFPFGLNPAFPFLTGAGGFLQTLTHGLTGLRPHFDFFRLDPVLPPQLQDGVIIKGLKWQGSNFDVKIGPKTTIITRKMVGKSPTAVALVQVRGHIYRIAPGQSISVDTRRPDRGISGGNLALCSRAVWSDSDYLPQNYPLSIVDGSNSTSWQPVAPQAASVIIDLGQDQMVSGVTLIWGLIPPREFGLRGRRLNQEAFYDLAVDHHVQISAPYKPEEAHLVQIRELNVTAIRFRGRQGTYGDERNGATVAEVVVF